MLKIFNKLYAKKPPNSFRRWGLFIELWQSINPVFRFIAAVLFLLLVFYIIILPSGLFQNNFYPPYINFNARISAYLLSFVFTDIHIHESIIKIPDFSISLKKGCEALEPTFLFITGVIAFPSSWYKKTVGIFFGILILSIINLIRVISLFFLGYKTPEIFSEFHIYIWPAIFIILAVILWLTWLKWVVKPSELS